MISGADVGRVDGFGHGGIDRAGGDGIDADAKRGKLDGLLLGEVGEPGIAGAIGGAQG